MTNTNELPPPAPGHPEEMTASLGFRFGEKVGMRATVRTTPAGLVSVGLLILSVAALVWAARRETG